MLNQFSKRSVPSGPGSVKRELTIMKTKTQIENLNNDRAGSTLIIVIALLGLLAFTGMLMFTFAAQERAASEYFSEGAKTQVEESDDPFPWALEQMIVGPSNQQKTSILWSPTRRYSLATNAIGADVAPHTGTGFHVAYNTTAGFQGLPMVDNNYDGVADPPLFPDPVDQLSNRLNFVDAAVAWAPAFGPQVDGVLGSRRNSVVEDKNGNGVLDAGEDLNGNGVLDLNAMPEPDVDYTYPDINSLFLAYKGWSIRDNGTTVLPRYERVFTIIPSFFRPQYLKSARFQGFNGIDVPTDNDWYNEVAHPQYSVRSFRPNARHVAGFDSTNTPVLRFLDATNPLHAVAIATLPKASGAFPLRPGEGNPNFRNSPEYGRLGVWTGHGAASAAKPATASRPALPATFELDSDNDGDGIREGIWLDLHYPLQETAAGVKYVVMHSFTIEDLDALIDLNSHGNLAGLPRTGTVPGYVGGANLLGNVHTSQSNQGLGPHEINPLYALAPFGTLSTNPAFAAWYLANPSNPLEQANMEWMWLLAGRIDNASATPEVRDGRWGDASALWYHVNGGGARSVTSLPRPGRAGNLATATSNVAFNFGGLDGFDDNQDTLEGIASTQTGRIRGFVHPIDYAGRGRRTSSGDPRVPNMSPRVGTLPERWGRYLDYSLVGNNTGVFDSSKYLGGQDGTIGNPTVTGDNLIAFSNAANPAYNANFENPYETIMDHDHAVRPEDQLYGVADLVRNHLTKTDQDSAEGLSNRLVQVAPITFADNSDRSSLFTTLSNSFRYTSIQHDLSMRPWEWSADSDNDQFFEFPPAFGPVGGKIVPFTAADPFRPQTRRLLFAEAVEGRGVQGQLPLSINHILDVNRTEQTPAEGTPEFLNYMKRTGLRFRPLTEHPLGSESDGSGGQIMATLASVPTVTVGSPLPVFPPRTPAGREFWARRDRQLLARDIYVLLYTIGGAQWNGGTNAIWDYTGDNNARALYTEDRLRQMAQFAVNMVDAMDADNVVTKFEFDKNLGNGWNLDDDPFTFSSASDPASTDATSATNVTKDGMYPDDAANRGVVYGVEAQPLAFSEVLAVRSATLPGDHAATQFVDTNTKNDFLFFELQNLLPTPLTL